jgi:hypothetical protein
MDTTPEVDVRYRAMLLSLSGEARLKMAGSMYATARALVVASILEADPSTSPAALRQAVFMRFYGDEFDEAARARILDRLAGVDSTEPPGREEERRESRRRVALDWDELEIALTAPMDEMASYLDLRTGRVRWHRRDPFDGEPEGEDLSEEEVAEGCAEGSLIFIEPFSSSVEWSWMADFAASVSEGRLRDRLEDALHGRRPFRGFKDVLGRHPAERERWFRFHDARVQQAMQEWLEENGIEPTTPPPTRRGTRG